MRRRIGLALFTSVMAHVAVVVLALAVGGARLGGAVDFELTGVHEEVKDFPLGAPEKGPEPAPKPRARARPKARAPEAPRDEGTLASRAGTDAASQRGSSPDEDDAGPAPTNDLSAYGPGGSRLTVLMRVDRIKGTRYQAAVDQLLLRLPDRRELLEGTGLDLFTDFDTLLIATPNPTDPSVTFLAAHHHLTSADMKAALTRGARQTERTIVWRTERGRLVGERRTRKGSAADATEPPMRADDRILVLSDPGLAVIAPPAYRALLVQKQGPPPDGGTAPEGTGWASLLSRIDAEEGLIPSDAVMMLKGTDLVRGVTKTGRLPTLFGMEIPPEVSATVGIAEGPSLDVSGTFKEESAALRWEAQWPAVQGKVLSNPWATLMGFSGLARRTSLVREGNTVRLHVAATEDEVLRLLMLASQFAALGR
jgi:hypothetical protein